MPGERNTAAPAAGTPFSSKSRTDKQFAPATLDDARDALLYVSADGDRDSWFKVGAALYNDFDEAAFDLFDTWSQTVADPDRYDLAHVKTTWRSIKSTPSANPRTFASIAKEARANGWTPSNKGGKLTAEQIAQNEQIARERAKRQADDADKIAKRQAQVAARDQRTWDAATPITGSDHPYLETKGVQSYGLRRGTWKKTNPATGKLEEIENALLLKIRDAAGELHMLQAIFPNSDNFLERNKDFSAGGRMRGHFFTIGQPVEADGKKVILVAEGYATAASLHEATGHAVVGALAAGNLLPVAEVIRKMPALADATIILCGDNDLWTSGNPGATAAHAAADAVVGVVALPPFDESRGAPDDDGVIDGPTDWNDWARAKGNESVKAAIERALQEAAANAAETAAVIDKAAAVTVEHDALAGPLTADEQNEEQLELDDDVPSLTVEDMKDMFAKCQAVEDLDVAAGKIREQSISDADLAIVVPQYQNTFKLLSDGRSVSVADARRALRLLENDAERAVVAELNAQHAVVLAGDKAVVLRESPRDTGEPGFEVRLLSESAFRTFYRNRTVDIKIERDGETRKKTVPIADWWLKSADRRTYEGITFAPGITAHPDYYNLWHGYAVEPRAGSLFSNALKCRRLLSHIKMNVCRGNRDHFRYLLAWAADMLQDPGKKKGVALVLRGNKGSGKSKVAEVFASLLGQHSIKIAQMKHLVGNFNRHLANKLLVVAEESFWAGDKADDGPLKDMITSSTLTLEAKGIDAIEMKSFARIMMITNNNWAVPATSDERRYFVLDVGNDRREDHAYFAAIDKQLDDNGQEGRRALLAFLLAFDLSTVNLRKVPETSALREQRGLSLEPHDQFVYDALIDRQIAGVSWEWSTELSKEEVYNAYIDAGKKRSKSHLMAKNRFTSHLEQFGIKARKGTTGNRAPVYWLPDWSVAAEKFQAAMGVDIVALSETDEEGSAF